MKQYIKLIKIERRAGKIVKSWPRQARILRKNSIRNPSRISRHTIDGTTRSGGR